MNWPYFSPAPKTPRRKLRQRLGEGMHEVFDVLRLGLFVVAAGLMRVSCVLVRFCMQAFSLVGRTGTISKLVELPPPLRVNCEGRAHENGWSHGMLLGSPVPRRITPLTQTPRYKPTDCLNGLRVIAMVHVIIGHTFLMPEGSRNDGRFLFRVVCCVALCDGFVDFSWDAFGCRASAECFRNVHVSYWATVCLVAWQLRRPEGALKPRLFHIPA